VSEDLRCAFCDKSRGQRLVFVTAPEPRSDIAICDACAWLAVSVVLHDLKNTAIAKHPIVPPPVCTGSGHAPTDICLSPANAPCGICGQSVPTITTMAGVLCATHPYKEKP